MSTDFLFARPSFLRGMARVVDVGARLDRGAYNISATPSEADAKALLSDWQMVAKDIASAFQETSTRVHEVENEREGQEPRRS
jgi:hypothetical protein